MYVGRKLHHPFMKAQKLVIQYTSKEEYPVFLTLSKYTDKVKYTEIYWSWARVESTTLYDLRRLELDGPNRLKLTKRIISNILTNYSQMIA